MEMEMENGNGRSWKVMEGYGRLWKVMEGTHGRNSWKVMEGMIRR
jgi:hypothetical protein